MSFHCSGLCPSVIQGMVARVKPESDNQHTKEKSGQRTGLWFPNLALMYGEMTVQGGRSGHKTTGRYRVGKTGQVVKGKKPRR